VGGACGTNRGEDEWAQIIGRIVRGKEVTKEDQTYVDR
jgi:hypothetical protein